MIRVTGVKNIHDKVINLEIPSSTETLINGNGLLALPGLIDPHVHFRTPGMEYKEDWTSAALAAIYGGYTTVFDMPNTLPPTITADLLEQKKNIINQQLAKINIPLRYELYFGADKNHLHEIPLVKDQVVGLKVFMGCSTGNLVIDDDESLSAVFKLAAENNLLVAVHAEDEARIRERKKAYPAHGYEDHSMIRDEETAAIAVRKAIALCKEFGTRLYVLHASTQTELELIRRAKEAGLPVYAETTPHHLFLNTQFYAELGGKMVVNPPIRSVQHQSAVLASVLDGTIDTIGSDHAPHTLSEKSLAYGQCPSGMPGIETTLPLLLNAYHEGIIPLHKILSLTVTRASEIFNLPPTHDYVLVDLNESRKIEEQQLKTKCRWSAFNEKILRGWPKVTILQGHCFNLT